MKCELCEGRGYLPLEYPMRDPYDLEEKESRDSLEALQWWRLRTASSIRAARS